MSHLQHILYLHTVTSTQDVARELLQTSPVSAQAVVAQYQTAGRGRHGNSWTSAPGQSLLMTMIIPLQEEEVSRSMELAFVAALAAAEALNLLVGLQVQFKWSNDILVGERKIAGILIETAQDGHHRPFALIGVGVNLLQIDFPDELKNKATSVLMEVGRYLHAEQLAPTLLRAMENWTTIWRTEGLGAVLKAWRAQDATTGQQYRLPSGQVGIARGVSDNGELIVEVKGRIEAVNSAEPARGVYL